MPNVAGAYCAEEDLRTGDLRAPSYTSKEQYIKNAAEEIDTALGHLYVTPIVIPPGVPVNRPAELYLKKVNWLLASGRFILDIAAAGESDNLHAYGNSMLKEAQGMLTLLTSEELVLVGAEKIPDPDAGKNFTGPAIFNEDSESLVEGFYVGRRPYTGLGEPIPGTLYPAPVVPYG
jgi:hypothetical protein